MPTYRLTAGFQGLTQGTEVTKRRSQKGAPNGFLSVTHEGKTYLVPLSHLKLSSARRTFFSA